MAKKLYPPLIEGTIPAFSRDKNGTVIITVPFSLNRAVARTEITGFELKIKTVQGGTVLGTFQQTDSKYFDTYSNFTVKFQVSSIESSLHVGQYYKIQLAFLSGLTSNPTVGYYSTVGIIKYTSTPIVEIQKLDSKKLNSHSYTYTVSYSQLNGDSTEKLYSSRFKLYNSKNTVIIDSGDILHNVNNDNNSYEACESYTIAQDLEENELYHLKVSIVTTNRLEASSPKYKLIQVISVPPEIHGILKATNNFDDGFIRLSLLGDKNEDGLESSLIGNFSVSRAASNENYIWREIFSFSSVDPYTTRVLWDDYTTEQGVKYQYSIQQFNSNEIYSERLVSNIECADFEDAFLYDGTRQLKIRYNPKVATFKTDLLESKIDTIGSKYPFIFRNGNVSYKEFPISGLISYKMDDNEKFLTKDELGIISQNTFESYMNRTQAEEFGKEKEAEFITAHVETYNLESYNIFAERIFKMEVLDWLNNGETKLFRSPSEGNYIVRLLNNSLSPTDQLGRMLHTFNSTAYEVNNFSYEALTSLNLINMSASNTITAKWKTVQLSNHSEELDEVIDSLDNYIAAGVCSVITPELKSRIINAIPFANKYIHEYNNAYIIGAIGDNGIVYPLKNTVSEEQAFKQALLDLRDKNIVTYATEQLNTGLIYSIDVKDMMPGTVLEVFFLDAKESDFITIGATGAYKATFEKPVVELNIKTIHNPDGTLFTTGLQGSITYSYNDTTDTAFSLLKSYIVEDSLCKQFIGTPKEKVLYNFQPNGVHETTSTNLLDFIIDQKHLLTSINQIKFIARPQLDLFIEEDFIYDKDKGILTYPTVYKDDDNTKFNYTGKYYLDMEGLEEVDIKDLNPYYTYAICHKPERNFEYHSIGYDGYYLYANYNHGYYVYENLQTPIFTGYYLDRAPFSSNEYEIYTLNEYTHDIQLKFNKPEKTSFLYTETILNPGEENEVIERNNITDYKNTNPQYCDYLNVADKKEIIIKDIGKVEDLAGIEISKGVICEIIYQTKENLFSLETDDKMTDARKKMWELAMLKWQKFNTALTTIGNFKYNAEVVYSHNSDIEGYQLLLKECENAIIDASQYDEDFYNIIKNSMGNYEFSRETKDLLIAHENILLKNIQETYKDFIYVLQGALYSYERGSSK